MVPCLDYLPNLIQKNFEDLTMIEEQLISPISAIMSIYRQPSGTLFSRGYCANFFKDIGPLCKELPRLPADISIIIIQKLGSDHINKDFMVNRRRVEICLRYLYENNVLFQKHGITISQQNIAVLPENGIPEDLHQIVDEEVNNSNIRDNGFELIDQEGDDPEMGDIHTVVDIDLPEPKQTDKIKATLQFPSINPVPLNEYEFDGITILLFTFNN